MSLKLEKPTKVIVSEDIFSKRSRFVETTYGINSVISKQLTFVENAETG
jgi:hypothetical protein